jgi:hypothetical protein
MAHRGILTGENLRRRGWEGPHRCPLCLQEEETTDHLLLSCVYSKEVWQLALGGFTLRFTSRSQHPAPKLEFPLSLPDNKKGPNLHPLENSPKIHSLEDLARTK